MKLFYHLTAIVLLLNIEVVSASNIDSVLNGLTFKSELEEKAIKSFLTDSANYFSVFHAVDFEGTTGDVNSRKSQFEAFSKEFYTDKFTSSKASKQSKLIFNGVHDEYFDKYKLGAGFYEIFESGVYNCATASVLYGLMLEDLGIPYQIKVMPAHVYLIMYPDKEAIKLETTNPLKGYQITDDKAKREYVKFLRDAKMISEKEYETQSVNQLFETYYYDHSDIKLVEMIGILYYNYGLMQFEEQKWELAFNEFEKAKVFFNEERVEFMLMASLVNYLSVQEQLKYEDLKYVLKIAKYSKVESHRKNVIAYFNSYINEKLIDNGDAKSMIEAYYYVEANLTDTTLLNEIAFNYNFEMGRHYYAKGKYDASNDFFGKALKEKPNNINVQGAFIESLGIKLEHLEVDSAIKVVTNYWEEFPTLHSNAQFSSLINTAYLIGALNAFNINQISYGEECLESFEYHYEHSQTNALNIELVAETYSTIAVYYYGKGQYKSAKNYINKGLKYAPNNYQLNRALQSF